MKVVQAGTSVVVLPGADATIDLEVLNTAPVIDALTVEVVGVPAQHVLVSPAPLTLFPEASGHITVTFDLPDSYPAGEHVVDLVVRGRTPHSGRTRHTVIVEVPSRPAVRLTATPSVVRSRSGGGFGVEVINEGNEPLDVALRTEDTDRSLRTTLVPPVLHVPVGASRTCTVVVRGPRQVYGSDRDRPLTVVAEAEDVRGDVALTFRQRSTFSRGLVTALILLAIVAAWALAFILGMGLVLGSDPLTKVVPASLFAGAVTSDGTASGAPADALPRDGALPAGVGGTLSGRVLSDVDGEGVGRLTVEVLRRTREGLVRVSSGATQADGEFAIAGLFPGHYLVRVAADGYDELWYPAGASDASATPVRVRAQKTTGDVDLVVAGHDATLAGSVTTGLAPGEVTVEVRARPTWSGADASAERTTRADPDGAYSFSDLPAPGTYELTFSAEGFTATTLTERVLGGQARLALDVRLAAGAGSISGLVTDGASGLGGVQVSTTVEGEAVEVGTPTLGQVGSFVLADLPTPGTYVLSFAKDGWTTRTLVVALGPGESRTGQSVALSGGIGTVSGTVRGPDGAGLGGVAVVVGGVEAASTSTLTAGAVGTYTLAGLPAGRSITLTFSMPGYAPVSLPVTIGTDGPTTQDVRLTTAFGAVGGRVTQNGTGLVGVAVEVTDGVTVQTTTTTGKGEHGAGSYLLPSLTPGRYTVTAVRNGTIVASAIVTVRTGATTTRDLPVSGGG